MIFFPIVSSPPFPSHIYEHSFLIFITQVWPSFKGISISRKPTSVHRRASGSGWETICGLRPAAKKTGRSRLAAGNGYGANSHALWWNSKLERRNVAEMNEQQTHVHRN
jgi:hypothetical protein